MTRVFVLGVVLVTACAADGGGACDGPVADDGRCVPGGAASGSGGGSDREPDPGCEAIHLAPRRTIPSVELLIDRSGSMLRDFADRVITDPANDPQKFAAEQTALVGPDGVVTQLQASVYFGAALFPGELCPGLFRAAGGRQRNSAAAIEELLAAHPPDPQADTPTAQSIDLAVADFAADPPPPGSPPVIVLATDGLPNDCYNAGGTAAQDATVAAAADAFRHGVRLYLLSVGTKIDAAFQQRLANAGLGVQPGDPDARAYTAGDPASLAVAFQDIMRGIASCDLALDHRIDPADAAGGTVTLDGSPLRFGTEWTLDADGITLHLLGDACDALARSPDAAIEAGFGCSTVIL